MGRGNQGADEHTPLRLSLHQPPRLWIDAIERTWEGDDFTNVVDAADPGHRPLETQTETAKNSAQVHPPKEGC